MTLFMLITSDLQVLINYISFSESLFILMSIAALLWLRYKEPNKHRPIKVQGCHLWFSTVLYFLDTKCFIKVPCIILHLCYYM